MAVMFIKTMAMVDYIFEVGDIVELDPLREANWIQAGWCVPWGEDEERVYDEPVTYIQLDNDR